MKIQPINGHPGIAAKREIKTGRNIGEHAPAFAEQLKHAVQHQNRIVRPHLYPVQTVELKERDLSSVLSESEAVYIRNLYEADSASLCYNGRCETEELGPLGRSIDLSA